MAVEPRSKNKSHGEAGRTDAEAPAEILQPRIRLRRRGVILGLCLLTVALLSVSFAPFNCWYLAYVALVPWSLAVVGGEPGRWTVGWAYLAGLAFWAVNLYWLSWVTPYGIGYVAMVAYMSLYWLAAAVVLRAAGRRNWPMWIFLPVVWVALEYARAYVISGFPWFFLAHSQHSLVRLIQITDTTGQYGVSFFVAMVNGAVVDLLVSPLFVPGRSGVRLSRQVVLGPLAVILAAAGLLIYGQWRIDENTTKPGPVIGIVQHAFYVSLKAPPPDENKVLYDHMASTGEMSGAGCDLVIWPESSLPSGMNRQFLSLASASTQPALIRLSQHAEAMAELTAELGCPILAGGLTLHVNPQPLDEADTWLRRNSVLWFDGLPVPRRRYAKVHLVPFGEYVPFRYSWPGLHKLLRRFVPSEMPQLDPGGHFTRFDLIRPGGREWTLAAPICYEGTFARVCRSMVMRNGKKVVDVLVNLSNDGWFVRQIAPGRYKASTEHAQHLVSYVFRAIETRTPVVRAVNTGVSASIDSVGRVVAKVQSHGAATMVSGTLVLDGATDEKGRLLQGHGPKVLVDSRVTVYSLSDYDVFAIVVSGAAAVCAAWLRLTRSSESRKKANRG